MTDTRTQQIEETILEERLAFLAADEAGDLADAAVHYAAMDRALEQLLHPNT